VHSGEHRGGGNDLCSADTELPLLMLGTGSSSSSRAANLHPVLLRCCHGQVQRMPPATPTPCSASRDPAHIALPFPRVPRYRHSPAHSLRGHGRGWGISSSSIPMAATALGPPSALYNPFPCRRKSILHSPTHDYCSARTSSP
jgi:hypothetical protein